MGGGIRSPGTNCPPGAEEGDNSALDGKHEPEMEPRLGTDGKGLIKALDGDDFPLRVFEVTERFRQQTRTRLKDDSAKQYVKAFKRFAKTVNLESYTRRQLSGPKGRMLILAYLDGIPKRSWSWIVTVLKPVWLYGFDLVWLIDSKRDLPKLPRRQRRQSPPDAQVRIWAKALANEKDAYLHLLWLMIAQHGWRPSLVCRLKWRNVQYNEQGKPVAIVADGAQESFKTCCPVAARLTPDVVEALVEWRKTADASPDHPILPWKSATGKLVCSRVQTHSTFGT